MDWFQIGEGVCQSCILLPWLFNLYAESVTSNARLDEAQTEIKIAERNTNNLRYADDTTLMAESEEELKSLLMKVKEESEKACLRDFRGGPVAKTLSSQCRGAWVHPWSGN